MDIWGDGARWGWGVEGNRCAEDGGTAGDGDATRDGGVAKDGLHVGARSFYSLRIGGLVGRGGIETLCGLGASGRAPKVGHQGARCVIPSIFPHGTVVVAFPTTRPLFVFSSAIVACRRLL